MKRVLIGLLAILTVSSCDMIVNQAVNQIAVRCPVGVQCSRTENGWSITTRDTSVNGLVVSSSRVIEPSSTWSAYCVQHLTEKNRLEKNELVYTLWCDTPIDIKLVTAGQLQVLELGMQPSSLKPRP
jgi:hypothetical protein